VPGSDRNGDRVRLAYRAAYGREATEEETRLSAGFLDDQAASHEKSGRPDPDRLALADLCQALMGSSEFIYIP